MSFEDFGYVKDRGKSPVWEITKKSLLIGAVLFSIACFFYITVNAYYFVYHDEDSNNIKTIASPEQPIKVIDKNSGDEVAGIDKTIYDSIVGNKELQQENLKEIRLVKKAVTPIADFKEEELEPIKPKENKTTIIKNSPSAKKGAARVQIAALTSRVGALNYWNAMSGKYPNLFAGLNNFINRADLGEKGTFYRLQIGEFKDQNAAESFCQKFISQTGKTKADCIIVE